MFASHCGVFCCYGAVTQDLAHPSVAWCGSDTSIQKEGINPDFGCSDDLDTIHVEHGVNMRGVRKWLFRNFVPRWMNANGARVRS